MESKKTILGNFKRANPLMRLGPYLKHLCICLRLQAFERMLGGSSAGRMSYRP